MQNGLTPLYYTVRNEYFKTAKTLLDHKADVNARDNVSLWRRVGVCVDIGFRKRFTPCLAVEVRVVLRTTY